MKPSLCSFSDTHLQHCTRRNIPRGTRSEDESIALDIKVGKAVGHHEHGRRVSRPLDCSVGRFCRLSHGDVIVIVVLLFLLLLTILGLQVIPELDLTKERLGVAALVGALVVVVAIRLGEDRVAARRQHEKVADHAG